MANTENNLASRILGAGADASKPAAAPWNANFFWFSTDISGGTLYRSTGSAWVQVAPGVSSGGGGMTNPMTTKGDMIVGGTAGAANRLAVGADGTVLTADSTQTLGVKWAPVVATFSGARVDMNTQPSITHSAWVTLPFGASTYDTDSYHSNVTNNSRITIPAGLGGYFLLTTQPTLAANASLNLTQFLKNGVTSLDTITFNGSASGNVQMLLVGVYNLVAGDYVEVQVQQATTGNVTVFGASYSITKLG